MDKTFDFTIRLAMEADLQAMADAHQASILELGPPYYNMDIVKHWGRPRNIDDYREARDKKGEIYFVAEPFPLQNSYLYGFSSYLFEHNIHRLQGLYVRGTAARRGIGRNLVDAVERHAKEAGADTLHVEASLSGEAFYLAYGFTELNRYTRDYSGPETAAEVIEMVIPL